MVVDSSALMAIFLATGERLVVKGEDFARTDVAVA
jgi:uncharacterized protein with PIN domain